MACKATNNQKKVHCRYCGYEDSGIFCSQCGLRLDRRAELQTLRGITLNRLCILVDPWQRLFLTVLLLLLHPIRYFEALEAKGMAVGRIRLWTWRDAQTDKIRRPPLTPSGYLFVTAVLGAISVDYVDSENFVKDFIGRGIDLIFEYMLLQDVKSLVYVKQQIKNYSSPILVEVAIFVLLFALKTPYKVLLGVGSCRAISFTEYFLYTSVQFLFVANCLFFFVVVSGGWSWQTSATVMGVIVAYSIWYYLLVPLRLFPSYLCISGMRIVLAYIAMVLVTPYFMFSLPLFYLLYVPYRLYRYHYK